MMEDSDHVLAFLRKLIFALGAIEQVIWNSDH